MMYKGGKKNMVYLSDVIGEEYKKWKNGFIFFSASTGCGKTRFIIDKLVPYAQEKHAKILLLVNRVLLKEQISEELTNICLDIYDVWNEPFNTVEKIDNALFTDDFTIYHEICEKYEQFCTIDGSFPFMNIDIMTYQQLESNVLKGLFPKGYQYIVCDEAHYFHSDSDFSNTSFISYNYIIKKGLEGKTKIVLMSASAWILKEYLSKRKLIQHEYSILPTYPHVRNFYVYDEKDKIKWITRILEADKYARILFFTNRREVFREIINAFRDICCFLASEKSETYIEFSEMIPLATITAIDDNTISFNPDKQICISTSIMDNGVNIKDDNLKYIFCDFDNACNLVQAIGRKRNTGEGSICDIYIQYHKNIGKVDKIFTQFQVEKMVFKKQFKDLKKFMIENKYIGDSNFFTKFPGLYLVPHTAEIKAKTTLLRLHKRLLEDNRFVQECGYINYLASYLCVPVERITSITHINDNISALVDYIENIPNKIVKAENKEKFLQDFSILCPSFKNKTPQKINEFFNKNKLPYKLVSKQNASHEGKMYWEIESLLDI